MWVEFDIYPPRTGKVLYQAADRAYRKLFNGRSPLRDWNLESKEMKDLWIETARQLLVLVTTRSVETTP